MNAPVSVIDPASQQRKLPIGAELLAAGGAHFRVWAPRAKNILLVIEGIGEQKSGSLTALEMAAEGDGYYVCTYPDAKAGMRYRFRLNDEERLYPDPASRFQPMGPHGPSEIVDAAAFNWTDAGWTGAPEKNRVLYEMHIGTLTSAGTYRAAAEELPELARLGITVIEMMPLAEFDGSFGWGYDGVSLFAPYHHYGTPDDLRYFIDCAHAAGIAVILDVVYNHCGPSGCYLRQFSENYFTSRYECEWGDALNFDGRDAGPVREFYISNAGYWISEFHFDGLRLDATQQMFDCSPEHVISAVVRRVRKAAGKRRTYIVGENEPQHTHVVEPLENGGFGLDAVWNDDFHHSAIVAMTGHAEAYFTDHRGMPQEFISAAKWGYLFQGQWYSWQKRRRGSPALGLSPAIFVNFLQNHDQVANWGLGRRIHQTTSPTIYRAMTALLLLGPATPMLFQGQEFCASTPFHYFADHEPELAELVNKGRTEFVQQFPSLTAAETQPYLPKPHDPEIFRRCKLDLSERERHREAYALHRDLLQLRRQDPTFSNPRQGGVDGAVLGPQAFVLRFFSETGDDDRLLLVNLGADLALSPAPEPLLAPHANRDWQLLWSSLHPDYGGDGTPPLATDASWRLPGMTTMVLAPSNPGEANED
jgi:maltooligosyltrehalose trehalohydrolase